MVDDACMERTGEERVQKVEQTSGQGPQGADGAQHVRTGRQAVGQTGGLGGRGLHCADGGLGRLGGWGRMSHGRADWADGRTSSLVVGWTGRLGRSDGRVDKQVGLGLKGHIPRGWVHSWAPSPLALSERECAGCLGVQWGPIRFHVKHSNLEPGLTCLV